jgi:LmbE family N-acetylglucosaminyl deacetylase
MAGSLKTGLFKRQDYVIGFKTGRPEDPAAMRLCIVSPHLDDAVLSCGIRMQRAVAAGDDVLVLNVFTMGTNAVNRRAEEIAAQKVLGAQPFFLDELDAPDRDARYKSDIELFHGDFADVPAEVVARVAARIENFLKNEKADEVVFPLAAGTHIDHRIAYVAGQRIAHPAKSFYEDRPYILWPGILQARLNQLGCKTDVPAVTPERMMADIKNYHYLAHFVPPGAFRDVCLPRYFADLAAPDTLIFEGRSETLEAGEDELEKIYDSLDCYTSQMHLIYKNRETFLHDSLVHEQARSGRKAYLERRWTLKAL